MQQYTLEEIFEKKLLFLIPFYIFTHESRFEEYNKDEEALLALSDEALTQIDDKRYAAEMDYDNVEKILKLGIAFSGKKVKIKAK